MLKRSAIFHRYPWLKRHRAVEYVVMGDDLDAALSTVLFLHLHPNARLVGLYHRYETVVYSGVSWEDVLGAVWLDLDIAHPACRSVGHHIVRYAAEDELPGLANSCNLNELAGRSVSERFTEKYPLGTVHFLMWLYKVEIPRRPYADLLIWLADSAFINAQTYKWHRQRRPNARQPTWGRRKGFRWNVERWLQEEMPLRSLQTSFKILDDVAFERRMAHFQSQVMARAGLHPGEGQVASRHLKLSGYQCQPKQEALRPYLYRLLRFICAQTGWHVRLNQIAPFEHPQRASGRREILPVETLRKTGLPAFLAQKDVFSYVFQSRRHFNYTCDMTPQKPAS
ncbi:MAG: hypothetical protein ACP5HM_12275 [Anaerolineae bacterium]